MKKAVFTLVASALLLSACGSKDDGAKQAATATPKQSEAPKPSATPGSPSAQPATAPADQVKAFRAMLEELGRSDNGGTVDYDKVTKLYGDGFQKLAAARDSEASEQQIAAAIKAGKDGAMKPEVVKQLVDKLGQKVLFLAVRNEFKELETNFADKTKAGASLGNAKAYYDVLKTTVDKRDTAYKTTMASAIDGAFGGIAKAIESGNKRDFLLSKQVIDKTLMRTFYLAAGGSQGYAYKIEAAVKAGKDAKTEQAEGWAFFQSLYAYIAGQDKADADYIQSQFDLKTDAKTVKGDDINNAFVRGFALVAKDEYKQSFANWGQDKSPVTALEGALFIQLLEEDAKKRLGDAATATLIDKAGQLVEAAKANDRAKGDALYKEIEPSLDKLSTAGK